jgi:hypothetical protein
MQNGLNPSIAIETTNLGGNILVCDCFEWRCIRRVVDFHRAQLAQKYSLWTLCTYSCVQIMIHDGDEWCDQPAFDVTNSEMEALAIIVIPFHSAWSTHWQHLLVR